MQNWAAYHGSLEDQEFPAMTAFFDESGHSESTRVVAMGGAMAGPKQWGNVRQKWKTILARFGVGVFHMSEFENRRGEFSRWDENRKRSFLSDLISILNNDIFFLIGAAVVVRDFKRITFNSPRFRDPWYFCYQSCFEAALSQPFLFDPEWAGIAIEDANVRACFFEQHRQFTWGPVLFALAQERDQARGVKRSDGIIGWGNKQSSVHFQVADLIAYELRKHVENAVFCGGRPTRWPELHPVS